LKRGTYVLVFVRISGLNWDEIFPRRGSDKRERERRASSIPPKVV